MIPRLLPPSSSVPAGAVARGATWGDLDAVVSLHAAWARARRRRPNLRRGDLRARWLGLETLDDVLLICDPDDPDTIHASAELTVTVEECLLDGARRVTVVVDVEGQVHPDHVGRGFATWLLDQAARRARDEAADLDATGSCLRTTVVDGDDSARRWFMARGFEPTRHLLQLRLDLHAAPPAPRWPAGITVRSYEPGIDDAAVWRCHQLAFGDVPTSWPMSLEDFVEDRLRDVDPDLVLLVHTAPGAQAAASHRGRSPAASTSVPDSDPVAIMIGRLGAPGARGDGWIRDLGVRPEWRRRGIAMALLRETFARFRDRGLTGVALDVDDVTVDGAVQLYRRAGMRVVHRTDVFEQPVSLS